MRGALLAVFVCALLGTSVADAQSRQGWSYSSETRAAIEALGSAPVAEIPLPTIGIALSSLTKNFGDPRGDGSRSHEGLDIMAPQNTPVASPTDAVVTRAGNGSSSGLYVRTANPGGETFVYMHLSKIADGIAEGKAVKRGDIIGFVGNTGNASGGAPHLHFEIRKGSALDPYPRITSVFTADEQARIAAAAQTQGVTVTAAAPITNGSALLKSGDSGIEVAQLQKFLIDKNVGAAAAKLAAAGATGYFGAITEAALREYQANASTTATGYVDKATYQLIFASRAEGNNDETEEGVEEEETAFVFTRDLERGMHGEDVRALQKFLNANGFPVAASGDGSPGNETIFFGPATQSSLIKFQEAKNIAPAAGYFGPKTRAALAML